MRSFLLAAALATALPASAATITERWHFDTLDYDGGGRMRFTPFDSALGTLTGARFHIAGSYLNDALIVLQSGFDPPVGTVAIKSVFVARVFGGVGPDVEQTQTVAYDHDLFPVVISLSFEDDITFPQLPDGPLDTFLSGFPLGGEYNAGSVFSPPVFGGRGTIDGMATLTYEYEAIPEPGTLGLLGGALLLAFSARQISRRIA